MKNDHSLNQINNIYNDLNNQKEEARETKLQLDQTVVSYTRSEMTVQKLNNQIKSKENYTVQIQQFYEQTNDELKTQQDRLRSVM